MDTQGRSPAAATLVAKIDFRSNGEGTITFGQWKFPCLGNPILLYPADSTIDNIEGVQYQDDYKNAFKFKIWNSNEFESTPGVPFPMPWAVKLWGAKGIFIHEGVDNIRDYGGPSSGCVHLRSGNAKTFYDGITGRTRILVTYPWSALTV